MNKPKKPAVVAKTAAKKRGRPVGSKNQKIIMTFDDKPFKVDWEKLAKQLQAALSGEIKDNDAQQKAIDNLLAEALRTRTFSERLVCLLTGKV